MVGRPAPLATRLWRRVDVRGPDDCWEWRGARGEYGHGRIGSGAPIHNHIGTHRVAWELARGPIPDGMFVCHRCDNPPCCNPAHLYLGTPADNSADMAAKKRCRSGASHPMAVLTELKVLEIWGLLGKLPERLIAEKYGVSQGLISRIARRLCWAHLTADLPPRQRGPRRGRYSRKTA